MHSSAAEKRKHQMAQRSLSQPVFPRLAEKPAEESGHLGSSGRSAQETVDVNQSVRRVSDRNRHRMFPSQSTTLDPRYLSPSGVRVTTPSSVQLKRRHQPHPAAHTYSLKDRERHAVTRAGGGLFPERIPRDSHPDDGFGPSEDHVIQYVRAQQTNLPFYGNEGYSVSTDDYADGNSYYTNEPSGTLSLNEDSAIETTSPSSVGSYRQQYHLDMDEWTGSELHMCRTHSRSRHRSAPSGRRGPGRAAARDVRSTFVDLHRHDPNSNVNDPRNFGVEETRNRAISRFMNAAPSVSDNDVSVSISMETGSDRRDIPAGNSFYSEGLTVSQI